ncbi:MAG: ComF family protein [Acidobacteria bacterium]|nr:ComF family protein [Acidobacteriota bacterium]
MNATGLALSAARRAADGLLAVLVAPRCAACGHLLDTPTSGPVCDACWAAVRPLTPPVCEVCGDALPSWRSVSLRASACARCRRGARTITRSRAVGAHEGALRTIIHALKYDRRRSIAPRLAVLIRNAGVDVLSGSDCAVPVPLHWRRRRSRGFNQAADLAAHLGLPVCHVLRRRRWTRPQVDLPASRRHGNVKDAFAMARPRWPWRSRKEALRAVRDRCVVLVDDVSTTGATLEACARVLKAAGAREIRALTVARVAPTRSTGPPPPRPASAARRQS